jgi:hypothetical protein
MTTRFWSLASPTGPPLDELVELEPELELELEEVAPEDEEVVVPEDEDVEDELPPVPLPPVVWLPPQPAAMASVERPAASPPATTREMRSVLWDTWTPPEG